MRWLFLASLLTAAPPWAAAGVGADETLASERLAARARETLDGILGPGRSKVMIEVRGERVEIHSETELITPLDPALLGASGGKPGDNGPLSRVLDLPGYTKDGPLMPVMPGSLTKGKDKRGKDDDEEKKEMGPVYTQRDHEQSKRDPGFEIKQVQATVVLDTALDDAVVRDVSQLLPQLLLIDGSRGDTLTILRAPLRPAWKGAFSTPDSLRKATYAGIAALIALIIALIAGSSFVRAARAFAEELGKRRPAERLDEGEAEPLPELMPGAPPDLLEAGEEGAAPGEEGAKAIGRRFDFLAEREPAHCANALSGERPEDVALVFGYLAEAMPDVASRVFSQFSPDYQSEVSGHLLKLRVADPERLSEIEERLKHAVEHGLKGSERLGRILSRVTLDTRSDLLGRLTMRDQAGASEVERHLFTIEDIETLSQVELRRLIASVPYENWGYALRGVPPAVIDRVLAELPEGPRELVRDVCSSPQPRDKVLEARSKILDSRAELAAKGEIKMGASEAGSELM